MRVLRRGTIYLAHMKSPACSDLAADDMTNLIIWAIVRTGTLILGTGTFLDSMMCDTA